MISLTENVKSNRKRKNNSDEMKKKIDARNCESGVEMEIGTEYELQAT